MNLKTETPETPTAENRLPRYDMSDIPTGCCPRFNPAGWDDREIVFKDKLFVKAKTKSVMHVPVNMGKVFQRTYEAIDQVNALDSDQFLVLSRELSPWTAEHLFSVTKFVPNQNMIRLSGTYHTRVFEGPFSQARTWYNELKELGQIYDDEPQDIFVFYTTCPKCAKTYGKNYVVGFVGHEENE